MAVFGFVHTDKNLKVNTEVKTDFFGKPEVVKVLKKFDETKYKSYKEGTPKFTYFVERSNFWE